MALASHSLSRSPTEALDLFVIDVYQSRSWLPRVIGGQQALEKNTKKTTTVGGLELENGLNLPQMAPSGKGTNQLQSHYVKHDFSFF